MKSKPRMKNKGFDPQSPLLNGKYSDDEGDTVGDIDLPVRKAFKPQHYIEAQIQDGDTLQAIALRFNCTVSMIMRANNILRENEIFAKRVLKIPVAAYSLLTEGFPLVHSSGHNSPTRHDVKLTEGNKENIPLTTNNDFQQKLIVASVNASEIKLPKYSNANSSNLENHVFPSSSKDLNHIVSSSLPVSHQVLNPLDPLEDHLTPLLLNHTESPKFLASAVVNQFSVSGADLGIKWIHLIGCILLMAFVVPLVYVVYIAEHPEKYPHYKDHHH